MLAHGSALLQDDFAFGAVARYIQLDVRSPAEWDAAITASDRVYRGRMHNLCCDNCHSHAALALDSSGEAGKGNNMVHLACWMFVCGTYTTPCRAVLMWLPFVCLLCLVLAVSILS
jgi:hypothetical protein